MTPRLAQFLRYGATAGIAAFIDLAGFVALTEADLPAGPAAAMSFLGATVVNYVLTARFVFFAEPSLRGYGRFLTAATAGFFVNVGVTLLVLHGLDQPPLVSKIAGIGTAFVANFGLNVVFVFRPGAREVPLSDARGIPAHRHETGLGPQPRIGDR